MKGILENSEVFQAYARIDYCYFAIRKISERHIKQLGRLQLPLLQSRVGGKNDEGNEIDALIELLKEVIQSKQIVGADPAGDKEMLDEIIILKNKS